MHALEHCITDLKSLKAVVKALKLEKVCVPKEIYKRIHCEMNNRMIADDDGLRWGFGGYTVRINRNSVWVDVRK